MVDNMKNRPISNEHGFTLLEVLLTLVISTIVLSVLFGVFTSSITFNKKTQSHVNLRQEANLIITQLRQLHQGGDYSICYNDLLPNNEIFFSEITLDNGGSVIDASNPCGIVSPLVDLDVNFTIANRNNQEFEVNTVIEYRRGIANVTIELPENNKPSFYQFLKDKNVFVYGSELIFEGGQINGPNAAMVIRGNLHSDNINGGALSNVSYIYIDGNAYFNNGSAGFGSSLNKGVININGDLTLWSGTRNIYGDVYVNGDFRLKDARIYGNVYVNGNVVLDWTPSIFGNVYYTGSLSHPNNYNQEILAKVIKQPTFPGIEMPNYNIPSPKPQQWYSDNGYLSNGELVDNLKVFSDNYISNKWKPTTENVIIVSKGDINITRLGGSGLTGILFAPNGKVTFEGAFFEGVVIARDGFFVTSGGTRVTFKNIEEYVSIEDAPF
jgi:prepilin-type N-terminal cleavage/methylation domain-containing protein